MFYYQMSSVLVTNTILQTSVQHLLDLHLGHAQTQKQNHRRPKMLSRKMSTHPIVNQSPPLQSHLAPNLETLITEAMTIYSDVCSLLHLSHLFFGLIVPNLSAISIIISSKHSRFVQYDSYHPMVHFIVWFLTFIPHFLDRPESPSRQPSLLPLTPFISLFLNH